MQVHLSTLGSNRFKAFNVNCYVYVKLTDKGIDILKERHEELNDRLLSMGGTGLSDFELNLNEHGYYSNQFWVFMEIFGPHIGLTSNIFETEILFKNKDLKEKVF